LIRIDQLKKYYGNQLILSVDSLQIQKGIHWVTGRNGSGKTTFFKMLSGIIPYNGEVFVDNALMNKNYVLHRRLINYGEAEPTYPRFLKGIELVKFIANAKQAPANQSESLADDLGIDYLNHAIGTYSSGMLKKLSVMLAFLGSPKWILLDEPIITVDVQAVETISNLILKYFTENNISFLISSHQAFETGKLKFHSDFHVANQTIIAG
jgi:ABC-2 type transport system ATP-binding protein